MFNAYHECEFVCPKRTAMKGLNSGKAWSWSNYIHM